MRFLCCLKLSPGRSFRTIYRFRLAFDVFRKYEISWRRREIGAKQRSFERNWLSRTRIFNVHHCHQPNSDGIGKHLLPQPKRHLQDYLYAFSFPSSNIFIRTFLPIYASSLGVCRPTLPYLYLVLVPSERVLGTVADITLSLKVPICFIESRRIFIHEKAYKPITGSQPHHKLYIFPNRLQSCMKRLLGKSEFMVKIGIAARFLWVFRAPF